MPGHEEALATSVRIAERVERTTRASTSASASSPRSSRPDEKTPEEYLRELCEAGPARALRRRPARPRPRERLEHELGIISRMGFASYFLIVWDFVRFAREQGIPSSARGSACGALGQLRALPQPRRPAQVRPAVRAVPRPEPLRGAGYRHRPLPGAARRGHRVRPQKYGEANVAQIGTFGTMAAKAAHQGRRPGAEHPAGPRRPGHQADPDPAEHHARRGPQGRARAAGGWPTRTPRSRELIDFARRLEGTTRNVGTHAAGVVIADRPLERLRAAAEASPNKDKDKEVVTTQWEMGDVEKAGLLKMDFLGLRNLTSLDKPPSSSIEQTHRRAARPRTSCRSTTRRPTSSCSAATPRASSSSKRRASATCWSR